MQDSFEGTVEAFGSWCCRLSGLLVRLVVSHWPVWKCADRVQIDTAGSKPSFAHWFSRPRLIDRLPLLVLTSLPAGPDGCFLFALLLSPPAQAVP